MNRPTVEDRFRCVLTDRSEHGWLMEVFKNEERIDHVVFPTDDLAIAADDERHAIDHRDGSNDI